MKKRSQALERPPRIDVRRTAILINTEGEEEVVTIINVSSGGFAVETAQPLYAGQHVRLRVDRSEELSAQICWTMGNDAGGIFTEHIKLT